MEQLLLASQHEATGRLSDHGEPVMRRAQAPHVVHVLPGFGIGGMELRTASIINAMAAAFRHTIVALKDERSAMHALSPDVRVCVSSCPPAKLGPLPLRSHLRELRPDLLLTYNWGAFNAVMGCAWTPFCPVIHHECGLTAEEHKRLTRRRALLRRLFLPRIHKTITVSQALRELLIGQAGIPEAKVRFIRSGVDTARFHSGRCWDWRRSIGVGDDTVLYGFVGHFRPEKNLILLLTAFAEANVTNSKLVLIGEGPLRERIENIAADLGIRDRVVFAGAVDDPAPYFRELDVFTMSSITEQTPNALLQAMASGLPCVCTNVGDTAEILGSRKWVFDAEDRRGYVEALRAFASSPRLRLDYGTANRIRCESEYSFANMVEAYKREYCNALARPEAAAI